MDPQKRCIFCKIAAKEDPKTTVLYEDDKVSVFKDIKPVSQFHFLVISKEHIRNAAQLKLEHLPLLEHMEKIGKETIAKHEGKVSDCRIGFHWPPFNSVNHLHLHVIFPFNQINFFHKMIFPATRTPWFAPIDWIKLRVQSLGNNRL
ncbi:Histidine triad nucleotide-binding protein 3 [Trichoplax sp. H2]|nr:Histidine triad nucleotide-binding protein 3 [Trichoplax sp. H2]|eukprot:RDD47862.1 Histidine triad nucleotide-binding protein 3 [Trichoplax sp. H2]